VIDASLSFDDGRVRLGVQDAASSGNGSGAPQALPLPVAEPGPGDKAARTTWKVLVSSVSH
jgi:hypothetical protein